MSLTLEEEIASLTAELYGKLPLETPTIASPIDALSDERKQILKELQDTITKSSTDNWYTALLPNKDIENVMNNPMTYYRYCNGFEWNMDIIVEKLKAMVDWRVKVKPGDMIMRDLKHQGPTKLLQCYGFDKQFRPIIYANMRFLDKDKNWDSDENIALKFNYFVYINEIAVERMAQVHPNIYQALWIIDMDDCSLGLNLVKKTKDMFLQFGEFSAERLAGGIVNSISLNPSLTHSLCIAIIINTSWTLSIVWNFVKLFLTENVVERYKLIRKGDALQGKTLDELIDVKANGGTLLAQFGGPVADPFDIEKIIKLEDLKKQFQDQE